MKRRALERRLLQAGWIMTRHGHKHDIWARGESELAVPRHPEINEITAQAILRAAEGERH
jgi:N-acyl-L-homoserine lactone synthetase